MSSMQSGSLSNQRDETIPGLGFGFGGQKTARARNGASAGGLRSRRDARHRSRCAISPPCPDHRLWHPARPRPMGPRP